ncbi:MAG: sensor histidine kinase, partial [Gaiellaceae bacterium]
NVVKHADTASAHVRIDLDDEVVTMEIRDVGNGFDPTATSAGRHGIESMKSRATEIGGRLSIATRVGQGTAITVTLPAEADG